MRKRKGTKGERKRRERGPREGRGTGVEVGDRNENEAGRSEKKEG